MPTTPGCTLTFTLTDTAGNSVPGKVVLTLCGLQNQIPRIANTEVFAQLVYEADANSSGFGTVTFFGNYQITPANTYFSIAVYPGGNANNVTSIGDYRFTGPGTYDLSSISPISGSTTPVPNLPLNAVITNPQGVQTIQTYGLNLPGGLTIPSTGALFIGPADSAFSDFAGGAPAYFGSSATDSPNRIGVVNAPSTTYEAFTVIKQDDFSTGSTGFVGANFQAWTTNTGTISEDAIVFPSVVIGGVMSAHHIGTGNLSGTNNGPTGALITATNETAAHVSAVTAAIFDIGNSGGGTVDTATAIWIPSIGDPGSTITTARGLYVAPQVAGAGTTWALYVDGTTQSYFGGNIVVPAEITNPGVVVIAPSIITFPAPSVTAFGGASTTYTYTINALKNGVVIAQSAPTTITNGPTTLSNTNYNIISWTAVPQADHYTVNNGYTSCVLTTALTFNDTGVFASYALPSQNGFLYTPNGVAVGSVSAMEAADPDADLFDSWATPGTMVVSAPGTIPFESFASSGIVASVLDTVQTGLLNGVNVGVMSSNPTVTIAGYYAETYLNNTTGTPNVFGFIPYVGAGMGNGNATEATGISTQANNYGTGTVALATNLHALGFYNNGTITEADAILIEDVSAKGTDSYAIHVKNQAASTLGSASWAIKVDGGQSEFDGPVKITGAVMASATLTVSGTGVTGFTPVLTVSAPANSSETPVIFGQFNDNTSLFEGVYINSNYTGNVTNSLATHYGQAIRINSLATGGVYGAIAGLRLDIEANSSMGGTVTNLYGIDCHINSGTGAAQTNYTCFSATMDGTTDATSGYAFRAQAMAGGAATNLWGIYVDNAPNFLGGNTQLSGIATSIVTKTSNYTTTANDHTVLVNSSGSVTITLLSTQLGGPSFVGHYPATIPVGQTYVVKNINTGTVTVVGQTTGSPASTPNIDGATSYILPSQNSQATFQWDGSNWWASPSPNVFKAVVILSASDIINLGGSPPVPKVLVSAPGIGKMVLPIQWSVRYTFGTTPFTVGASTTFELTYAGLTAAMFLYQKFVPTTGFVDQTVNMIATDAWGSAGSMPQTAVENQSLILAVDSALSGGDGTMTVTVLYTIISV